jgi:hypothetical protein
MIDPDAGAVEASVSRTRVALRRARPFHRPRRGGRGSRHDAWQLRDGASSARSASEHQQTLQTGLTPERRRPEGAARSALAPGFIRRMTREWPPGVRARWRSSLSSFALLFSGARGAATTAGTNAVRSAPMTSRRRTISQGVKVLSAGFDSAILLPVESEVKFSYKHLKKQALMAYLPAIPLIDE